MKKYILILLLLIAGKSFAQNYCHDTVVIRVIDGAGVGITGLTSADITFRYAPYSADIAGLTVQEFGTAGNYRIFPFTTFGKVRLYIGTVLQNWFGTQLVGCGSDYFTTLGTNQTVSGQKTFSGVLVLSGSSTTIYYPYLSSASSWYSTFSTLPGRGLVWREWLESMYDVDTSIMYLDGSKVRLRQGYKLYGYNSTTAPFLFNTNHFTYSNETNGLSLTGYNDSNISDISCLFADSVDGAENTHIRSWGFKRVPFYFLGGTKWDIKLFYEKYLNSGRTEHDSSFVINEIFETDNTGSIGLGSSSGYVKIDSVYLDPGTWKIDWMVLFERSAIYNSTVTDLTDTVEIALKQDGVAPNVYVDRYINDIFRYESGDTSMNGGVISWVSTFESTAQDTKIYLYAKYYGTAVETALSAGQTHYIRRSNIITTRIK